ncbi:hypothetical protein LRP50_08105 [Enterovibrio sp. ZSDZ42]|uniref:Uncharacterized protein n=1 Tax=Enterovibrio gelatinilyticus TaxID=2899819 RepID=A0ABT5QYM5_9GAMM|nr:hypothetical protein [Enterovibrio sp. ZSDZ42]MDD1793089.1 hypothetical protein [Enterovibrio sp. ZSDZ42]
MSMTKALIVLFIPVLFALNATAEDITDATAGQKAEIVEKARVQEIKDAATDVENEAVLLVDEAKKKLDSEEADDTKK